MNQVILVGKISHIDRFAGIISLNVQRDSDKSDVIPIVLGEPLNEKVIEYIQEGYTVGVKAKLQIDNNILRIKADQVTFIEKKE